MFGCCIALAPSLPLLTGFVVHCLLAVSLCQLASMEEGNSLEYGSAWHQLSTVTYSWCLHGPTIPLWIRAKRGNIRWLPGLKYLQVCWLGLIGRRFILSSFQPFIFLRSVKWVGRPVPHAVGRSNECQYLMRTWWLIAACFLVVALQWRYIPVL